MTSKYDLSKLKEIDNRLGAIVFILKDIGLLDGSGRVKLSFKINWKYDFPITSIVGFSIYKNYETVMEIIKEIETTDEFTDEKIDDYCLCVEIDADDGLYRPLKQIDLDAFIKELDRILESILKVVVVTKDEYQVYRVFPKAYFDSLDDFEIELK